MLELKNISYKVEGANVVEIIRNVNFTSMPAISAFHQDAQLIHEAAIGRISSEQLIKLMSLG